MYCDCYEKTGSDSVLGGSRYGGIVVPGVCMMDGTRRTGHSRLRAGRMRVVTAVRQSLRLVQQLGGDASRVALVGNCFARHSCRRVVDMPGLIRIGGGRSMAPRFRYERLDWWKEGAFAVGLVWHLMCS